MLDGNELRDVEEVDGEDEGNFAVLEFSGTDFTDIGLGVGEEVDDIVEEALTLAGIDLEGDGKTVGGIGGIPFDGDDTGLVFFGDFGDIATVATMDGDAEANGNEAEDIIAGERVTAFGEINFNVIFTKDAYSCK